MHALRREGAAVPPLKIKSVMTTRTPPRYAPEPGRYPGDHQTDNNETCCPLQTQQAFKRQAGDYRRDIARTESPEHEVALVVLRLGLYLVVFKESHGDYSVGSSGYLAVSQSTKQTTL